MIDASAPAPSASTLPSNAFRAASTFLAFIIDASASTPTLVTSLNIAVRALALFLTATVVPKTI